MISSDDVSYALTAPPDTSTADRLGVTIFFAVLAHLILILGVTFTPEPPSEHRIETLDVVLVPWRSEAGPDQPDYLAQANQDGGGAEKVRPATPGLVSLEVDAPASTAAGLAIPSASSPRTALAADSGRDTTERVTDTRTEAAVEAMDTEATALDATLAEALPVESARPLEQPPPAGESIESPAASMRSVRLRPDATRSPPRESEAASASVPSSAAAPAQAPGDDTAALADRSRTIAALSAEIERKLQAYTERPRRKWISARTREHELAAYMDAWRRKVEHIGNLSYPAEAARRGLSGNLLLEVAINRDGTVEDITLRRSSGQPILDDAAIRIVKLAAPFSRFPPSVSEEVDILHIERTWIFHSGNHFTSP